MRLKLALTAFAVFAVGVSLIAVRTTQSRLTLALDAARDQQRELARLRAERDRLRGQLPNPSELAALQQAAGEHARVGREIELREAAPPVPPFTPGEWTPSASWSNRGAGTPRAALETALWAAAGGDVSSLSSLLELDAATRAKADALFAKLPLQARLAYPNSEALIASITLGRIPLAEAQIAWFHASDPDHAAAALLLNGTGTLPLTSNGAPSPSPLDSPPPMLPANHDTKLVTLVLHRSATGWRLAVPAEAIDRMSRDLIAVTK